METKLQKQDVVNIVDNILFTTKAMLSSAEAARYLGITRSYLYKLTMKRLIPHYKPCGKMCYFKLSELEMWLQKNRVATEEEVKEKAMSYCMKGGVK